MEVEVAWFNEVLYFWDISFSSGAGNIQICFLICAPATVCSQIISRFRIFFYEWKVSAILYINFICKKIGESLMQEDN